MKVKESKMESKVGILSRHAVPNYGSILQAYALQAALEKRGIESEYVDYRIPRDFPMSAALRSSGILGPIRALPKFISSRNFEAMRHALLHQSRRVTNSIGLTELLSEYDVLCVGGDQVWNVMSDGKIDGAYLLESASDSSYKFSFSSSFGKSGLRKEECERVRAALSRFNKISVREESGQAILERMGLSAKTVVDPVHMLTKGQWLDSIPPVRPSGVESRYCLIYNLHPQNEFNQYVSEACRHLGIQVVSIRPSLRKTLGVNLFYPSLGEFLWLFDNATCVLTDSFHGTAFSLLFNTPFVEILPRQYSERNMAILSRYDLESRISAKIDPCDLELESFDWARVNQKLAEHRTFSERFLDSAIQEFSVRF